MAYLTVDVGNGYSVNVDFGTKGIIRIKTDGKLLAAMNGVGVEQIQYYIGNQYQYQWREKINITGLSQQYEILGHVYPGLLSRVLVLHPQVPKFVKDYIHELELIPRTAVIDMGEAGKDNNRNIWDTLANTLNRMIVNRPY